MAIRITCAACRTVMKVTEGLTEQKKLRCTGCKMLIMITPDPKAPDGLQISYPKKADKNRQLSERRRQIGLFSAVGVALLGLILILWYSFSGSPRAPSAVTSKGK